MVQIKFIGNDQIIMLKIVEIQLLMLILYNNGLTLQFL